MLKKELRIKPKIKKGGPQGRLFLFDNRRKSIPTASSGLICLAHQAPSLFLPLANLYFFLQKFDFDEQKTP